MKPILALGILCALSFQLQAQVSFTLSSSPSVGSKPRSVVAADVNGDGRMDLICANQVDSTLTVLTNTGSGNFVSAGTNAVGNGPNMAAAADVNGDGKVDLISANYGGTTLSVLTNNGSGGFVLASSPGVGNSPACVVAADVNGDSNVDLISANAGNNTLSVLTNNGSGSFVLASSPSVGSGPFWVVAADVNGDGNMDLICVNAGNNTLSVLTNNGSGSFVLASSPGVGNNPACVAAADVNGNGKTDLICANFGHGGGNTLSVLTNAGSGNFVLAATLSVGAAWSVVAADVNGDGKVDLICANSGNKTLSVLTNNGSGGFGLALSPGVGNNPVSVAAADINGDGRLDLICANSDDNTLSVLVNTSPSQPVITAQPISQTVTVGSNANFSVTASGWLPLSYQWTLGQQNIDGATNASLLLTNLQSSQAGNYAVWVTNISGSTLSSNAMLTITPHHFTWNSIPSPRFAGTPFAVGIQARDASNGIFTNFTSFANLSLTNGASVAPIVSGSFIQGVWTGSVVIAQTASNLVLRAGDGQGHFGLANPISVIGLPNLGMLRSASIALFIWPVGYAGFELETSGSLSSPMWLVVPYSPIQIGDQYLLPLDMTGTNGFYRLWFPGP